MIYSPQQTASLIHLVELLDIPIYSNTTIGEIHILIKHRLLAEYGVRLK